jgi:hypothetical protein
MTPNEQRMWNDIAEAIEPYCVNGAGYIRNYYEDSKCIGFDIITKNSKIRLLARRCADEEVFDIEEDLRIFYKDPPGTFEGLKQCQLEDEDCEACQ